MSLLHCSLSCKAHLCCAPPPFGGSQKAAHDLQVFGSRQTPSLASIISSSLLVATSIQNIMPPPPKRTITLLEAHPRKSTTVASETSSGDDIRASTTQPPKASSTTRTADDSTTKSHSTSRSPTKTRRTSRHGASSTSKPFTETTRSSRQTSSLTVTEYSSTTTIYTTGFTTSTSTRLESPQPSVTISGPPVRRVRYEIPGPPTWFPYLLGALLAIMISLAVLFYCVNFPTTGRSISRRLRRWRAWLASRRASRYGYERLDEDAPEIELGSNDGLSSSPSPVQLVNGGKDAASVPTAAFTTSANTPGLHNTPTLHSRRRNVEDINVDTGVTTGLGIDFSGTLRQQKSLDETLLRPDLDKSLPKPPRSPALQAVQSARAYISKQPDRKGSTDLEAGLLKPRLRNPVKVSKASPPPSPGIKVLEMVGGSVDYAAEKMSRFMCDQVKGDPEEGLLLPVRDCEREGVVC